MKIEHPKFESPIEERLAIELMKTCHDGVKCEMQVPITAFGKNFRVDFMLTVDGRKVVVEADGRDFHELDKDRRRDAMILDDGGVEAVFRFCGSDIFFDAEGCCAFLSNFAPVREPDGKWIDDVETLRFVEMVVYRQIQVKPIVRFRFPLDVARANLRGFEHAVCVKVLGRTTDKKSALIQVQPNNFDRNYDGIKIWQIGDYLAYKNMTMEEWMTCGD